MGQRLNIEILYDGEELVNAYYHWGGYTGVALNLTSKVIDYYKFHVGEELKNGSKNYHNLAIDALESTYAKLSSQELESYQKSEFVKINEEEFTVEDREARRDSDIGTINVTPGAMNRTRMIEDARVTIDFFEETISFDVFMCLSDYGECLDNEILADADRFKLDIDLAAISFCDFCGFFSFVRNLLDYSYNYIFTYDNYIYKCIE